MAYMVMAVPATVDTARIMQFVIRRMVFVLAVSVNQDGKSLHAANVSTDKNGWNKILVLSVFYWHAQN